MCGSTWTWIWTWRMLIFALSVIRTGANLQSIEGIKTNSFINDTSTGNYYHRAPTNTTIQYTTTFINKKNSNNNINKSESIFETIDYESRSVPTPLNVTQIDLVNNAKVMIDSDALPPTSPSIHAADNSVLSTYERHLEGTSIIFGLARLANESNLNEGCYDALKNMEQSILQRETWAMKMLDSSGTKNAGFIFGHNFWLGSREACGAAQKPVGITLSRDYDYQRIMSRDLIEVVAPFDVNYRVLYLRHHSPWQVEIKLMSERIIHIGLCLPAACTSPEIQQLAEQYLEQHQFVDGELFEVHPEVLYMKELKLSDSFYQKISLKLFAGFLTFTGLMMLCASILNVKPAAEMEMVEKMQQQNFTSPPSSESSDQSEHETETVATVAVVKKSKKVATSIFKKTKNFIKCFDIGRNCEKLFVTRQCSANEIPVINGLRSISSIWIMMFHVLWYMYFTVDNKPFMLVHADRMFFQYVSSAPLLVDVFFTISGFLQTYNFLRNKNKIEEIRRGTLLQNMQEFFKILFHRYLRLAPLYFVIIGVVDLLSAYMQDVSVFHIHDRFDQICSQHWWRNVLFIQNLFSHQELCVNWTWSLACEMQFFILATAALFTYAKHPKAAKLGVLTAVVGNICWSFFSGVTTGFQLSFDATFATGTQIYINPFVRILPYLLGIIAAWYFIEQEGIFDISHLKEKCFWNLAILVFFCCIYSTFFRDISSLFSTTLFVSGRFLFSLSVCWMIIGSATGRGTWWSRLLEAKIFQHVNRLTYAIYLLNPFVIGLIFSMSQTSIHVDPLLMCIMASGFAVVVYLASIVFSLAFEVPYCNWSSMMLRRHKSKVA